MFSRFYTALMIENDLLSTINGLPPWQIRILAIKGRRPISTRELADKSGLSRATIKTLSRADSWIRFEVSTVVKFTRACGVDLLHQKYPKQRLMRMMKAVRGPAHLSTPQRRYWNSIFTGETKWRKTT